MACVITDKNAVLENGNQICGKFPELINSKIIFEGSGNVLYCEEGVRLKNSTLTFHKDGGVIYLSRNRHIYYLDVSIQYDSTLFMGRDNYINGPLHLIFSERKNIVIGDDCLFSFGIWMRMADPHLIYDANTHCRINPSRSIYIGDHVWIGQDVMLLRGTQIGSGSIVGAKSTVTGARPLSSNVSWAGSPIRKVRDHIFWTGECVHAYREADTQASEFEPSENYIYEDDEEQKLPFDEIEHRLESMRAPDERVAYLKQTLRTTLDGSKNRFYISG